MQGSVEGRSLAASRWSGYKEDAVWFGDQLIKPGEHLSREPQKVQVYYNPFFMEYPHDHTFTVKNGDGGYPEVHFFFSNLKLYTSILWKSSFRNIEFCHDLYSGNDRCLQFLRGGFSLMQYPIDAVSDLQLILKGLYVDITCPALDCPCYEKVYQPYNGSF